LTILIGLYAPKRSAKLRESGPSLGGALRILRLKPPLSRILWARNSNYVSEAVICACGRMEGPSATEGNFKSLSPPVGDDESNHGDNQWILGHERQEGVLSVLSPVKGRIAI
jgi:hypothetical protein